MGQLNFAEIQIAWNETYISKSCEQMAVKITSRASDQVEKPEKSGTEAQRYNQWTTKLSTDQTSANSTALFSQFEHSNYEKDEEGGVYTSKDIASHDTSK